MAAAIAVSMKLPVSWRDFAPLEVVDPAVARAFLRVAAGCSFLAFVLALWLYGLTPAGGLSLGLAVAFALLDRVRSPVAQARGLLAALCATTLVVAMLAWVRAHGVFSSGMSMFPLVVCSAGILVGMRGAVIVAAVSAACMLFLGPVSSSIQLADTGTVMTAGARTTSGLFHLVCGLAIAFVAGRVMRRLLERARSVESRQKEVFARSPLALMIHRDGRLMVANDSMARLFGYASAEAMTGMATMDLYDPSEHERIVKRRAQAKRLPVGERLPLAEFKGRRADGSVVHVRAAAAPIELSDGPALEALYVELGTMTGAERALLKSDAMLQRLFLTSPVCVMVTEITTGRYLMVNPGYERMTGRTSSEVLGRTSLEMNMWESTEHRDRFVQRVLAEGSVLDMPVTIRAKDGTARSIMLSGSTFEFEGQRCLVSQAHDVTQMETERREVAAILENASVGIALTVDGRFARVNRRLEEMLGWDSGALVGRDIGNVWQAEHTAGCAGRVDFVSQLHRTDGTALVCHTRGNDLPGCGTAQGGRVWIVEDITERHRIGRELELAKEAAEAGSRAKSAFLANMSHEIRTPLHGVMGLAQLASRSDIGVRQRETYLGQLIDSARALTHVISEVLDLSKIEAGQMALEAREFDLHELADSVCALYSPDAHTRGLKLAQVIEPDVPRWVQGDAVRVRQILVNFSSNAMKFTERGSVTIRLGVVGGREGGSRILLSVKDTGPGLDPWMQQKLFTPFMQADESTTRRFGGTGLGLSICRQLAQLMGGEVGVSSEPGRGSEFWAVLPLPAVQAPPAPAARNTDSALLALQTLQGARVLVVEDNPVNMMIATAQLEQWGVVVLQAGDGVEALEVLQREPRGSVDLVLMDLQMPRMGGEQAVRQMRHSHAAQDLPVVALTAAALVEEQERALRAGFNDFVTKPIEAERLRQVLLQWLHRSAAETAW